jgi:hypothetical protein
MRDLSAIVAAFNHSNWGKRHGFPSHFQGVSRGLDRLRHGSAGRRMRGRRHYDVQRRPANGSVPQGQPVILYVMAKGQPAPASFRGGNGTDQATIAFSRWGETVHTVPPASAVPITSVTSS